MLTTVSTHTNPLEAHIVRGRLEAEEIHAVIIFEHHIWAKWSISNAIGGVRVQVPEHMHGDAIQVIEFINSGRYETLLLEEQQQSLLKCPKCGSVNNAPHVWLWKLSLVVLFLSPLIMPYTSHLFSCDDCKHSWIAHEQRPYPLFSICLMFIIMSVAVGYFYVATAFLASGGILWK